VVAPPKVGRTAVLMDIASAIEANHPEVHLMVVLLDERPEEATAVRRHIAGEVVASLFDRPVDEHTMVAELALERAERLVEDGRDVVILVDGATRLARAYNVVAPANGRVLGGGLDSVALQQTKKFFGRRNVEEGRLLSSATALVGTGSVADDIVLAELSGAANMELLLDASSSDRRLLPPIDVTRSSTQHDDLLGSNERTERAGVLRRDLAARAASDSAQAALEHLLDRLASCPTNDELLAEAPGHAVGLSAAWRATLWFVTTFGHTCLPASSWRVS
jgi:transcription termination factor Rho